MSGEMNCDGLRSAMRQGRALTAEEQAHVRGCEACMDAWLESAVVTALETKPEVRAPEGFAAKVMARMPEGPVVAARARPRVVPWGLITAAGLVGAGLAAAMLADPAVLRTEMGMILEGLVAAEIAGIALWLGLSRQRIG
jgi:hypothetical protein